MPFTVKCPSFKHSQHVQWNLEKPERSPQIDLWPHESCVQVDKSCSQPFCNVSQFARPQLDANLFATSPTSLAMPAVSASLLQFACYALIILHDAIYRSLELGQVDCSSGQSKHQATQEEERPEESQDVIKSLTLVISSPGPELLSSHPD